MNSHATDRTFRLDSLPTELWDMALLTEFLRADDQTILRWVREGVLSPSSRRHGPTPT
jgi:hypothetical protein